MKVAQRHLPPGLNCLFLRSNVRTAASASLPNSVQRWSPPRWEANIRDDEVTRLARTPRRPLALADLVKHGRPPLSDEALIASANFTLSLLPARLAYRIQCLRNLPFIVVSNPHISKIYSNYLHSLSTLLPYQKRHIKSIAEVAEFTEVMDDLVRTHSNTIPTLARGFMECRKYISPAEVTNFLEEHLRARIGTRLIAEQHIALHMESLPDSEPGEKDRNDSHYIGVIDTQLCPADIVRSCEDSVAEVCELKYGVRPSVIINGQIDATFAHVPVHLEYILTELLKNAFRATIESENQREPIEVTIAAASDASQKGLGELKQIMLDQATARHLMKNNEELDSAKCDNGVGRVDTIEPAAPAAPSITIRIRDRGGGISPDVLPNIWSYSFTTFGDKEAASVDAGASDGMSTLSRGSGNQSSLAGLGYGLPLSRAYAEYFGGGISVQSLFGWGTDVYLTLQGVGKVET